MPPVMIAHHLKQLLSLSKAATGSVEAIIHTAVINDQDPGDISLICSLNFTNLTLAGSAGCLLLKARRLFIDKARYYDLEKPISNDCPFEPFAEVESLDGAIASPPSSNSHC